VKDSGAVEKTGPAPLLVGVTPSYPPMIFKQAGKIAGVEADLAKLLAQELHRPVQFVELRWEDQIDALIEGRTDIIMSAMSITRAREIRVRFTDHYFKSGLTAAFRVEDASKYKSQKSILGSSSTVGVIEATTGDVFVKRNFPNAGRIILLSRARAGAFELKRRGIDIFVHDAPSIIWLVSENEADLTSLWEPLNEEYVAWGVRIDDEPFLMLVNSILSDWKEDGTVNRVLKRWLPYLEGSKWPSRTEWSPE